MYELLCTTRVLVVAFGMLGGRGCAPMLERTVDRPAPVQTQAQRDETPLMATIRPARGTGLVVGIRVPFD